MQFNTYQFKDDVRNNLPYHDQWMSDDSPMAKLMMAIGYAINNQLSCYRDFEDQIESAKSQIETATSNGKAEIEKLLVSFFPKSEDDIRMAKEDADARRAAALKELTAHNEAMMIRLNQEIEIAKEQFKTRIDSLRNTFMDELRRL